VQAERGSWSLRARVFSHASSWQRAACLQQPIAQLSGCSIGWFMLGLARLQRGLLSPVGLGFFLCEPAVLPRGRGWFSRGAALLRRACSSCDMLALLLQLLHACELWNFGFFAADLRLSSFSQCRCFFLMAGNVEHGLLGWCRCGTVGLAASVAILTFGELACLHVVRLGFRLPALTGSACGFSQPASCPSAVTGLMECCVCPCGFRLQGLLCFCFCVQPMRTVLCTCSACRLLLCLPCLVWWVLLYFRVLLCPGLWVRLSVPLLCACLLRVCGQRGTHQTCAPEPSCLAESFACLLGFVCWPSCLCLLLCAAPVHTFALLVPLALCELVMLVV
jgi:hypothetical protein